MHFFNFLRTLSKRTRITLLSAILLFLAAAVCLAVFWPRAETPITSPETSNGDTPSVSEQEDNSDRTPLGDDTQDPENAESDLSGGAFVQAEDLHSSSERTHGIDVSKWQGKIDWETVSATGLDFAFVRIGYRGENGVIYKDANADYNLQQAQRAGLKVGVYFFSTALTAEEAREEADWTLSAVSGYPISYPIVYDCEGFHSAQSRMFSLTVSERSENAKVFLTAIQSAGYDTMLYTSLSVLEGGGWNLSALPEDTLIWIAQYPQVTYPAVARPDYEGRVDAWQYTDRGEVAGIDANVDLVVCYFSRENAAARDPNSRPEDAEPPLSEAERLYTPVEETVTAKDHVNLREGASTKTNIVSTLDNGQTIQRIGIGSNGWSKLLLGDEYVYAITSYLTTDLSAPAPEPEEEAKEDIVDGNVFTQISDQVTAKIEVNLRSRPTTDSEIVGTLVSGEFLPRTATSNRGWSRLIYREQEVYAVTSYLSNEVVSSPEPSDGFSPVEESVTAKSETNLRSAPSTTNSEIVYTLKNGEYVTRIGIHTNGWSKLLYNGQTVYAITSYLTA